MVQSKLLKTGYELESVHIVQTPISFIKHRFECDTKKRYDDSATYYVFQS